MTLLWRGAHGQVFDIHQWEPLSTSFNQTCRIGCITLQEWQPTNLLFGFPESPGTPGASLFLVSMVSVVSVFSFFLYFFISFFFFLSFLSTSFHIYSCRRHKIEDGAILQGKAALLPSGFKCSLSRKWQNQTSFHMNSHDLYNFSKEYHWCQVSPNSRIFKCHCFWRRILPLRCCFIFLVLPNMMIRKLHWSITISPIKMQLFWGYTWLY